MPSQLIVSELFSSLNERYRFIEKLGSGGMGVVFKAEDLVLRRTVAIKFLSSEIGGIPSSISQKTACRFQREAQALSAIDHPNLVKIYDFGLTSDNCSYIVMEYLDGVSLKDILIDGPLTLESAIFVIRSICLGMAHAHRRGIVHRDLKSSNILVESPCSERPRVILVDFGIATAIESGLPPKTVTPSGQFVGSPLYMAPEHAQGYPCDQRTDIYSLGCVAFELLTGSPPFCGNSAIETIHLHLMEEPLQLKDVSSGTYFPSKIESIVAKMLSKKPSDRYASMEQVANALDEVLVELGDVTESNGEETGLEAAEETAIEACLEIEQEADNTNYRSDYWDSLLVRKVLSISCFVVFATFLFVVLKSGLLVSGVNDEFIANLEAINNSGSSLSLTEVDLHRFQVSTITSKKNRIFLNLNGAILVTDYDLHRVGELKKLEKVDFGDTFLSDYCLKFLNSPRLKEVYMVRSLATDLGLKHLSRCKGLQVIDLSSNEITGTSVKYLDSLENLDSLQLNNCNIKSVAGYGLGQLNLSRVGLAGTKAADSLVEGLLSNSRLKKINLTNSSLSDSGLLKLSYLPHLTKLYLGGTHITDSGVESLLKRPKLVVLDISRTKVRPDVTETISKFSELEELYLGDLSLSSKDVEELKTLKKLDTLGLSGTRNSKVNFNSRDFPKLRSLDLSNTAISDSSLASVASIKSLQKLNLMQTRVGDAGLKALTALGKLKELKLSDCKNISDTAIDALLELPIRKLDIGHTGVTDRTCEKLARMKHLSQLNLAGNRISDTGLEKIKDLNLRQLDLSGTGITRKSLPLIAGIKSLRLVRLEQCSGLNRADIHKLRVSGAKNFRVLF